jgi:hypothetical protein
MKAQGPCPTCCTSSRPGLLWLGGNDWVECPSECEKGVVSFIEERFAPKERTVSLVGIGSFVERSYHPSVAHLQDKQCQSTG